MSYILGFVFGLLFAKRSYAPYIIFENIKESVKITFEELKRDVKQLENVLFIPVTRPGLLEHNNHDYIYKSELV